MNESMDRVLADWLDEGPVHGPREGLDRALAATRRVSQRPVWTLPEWWIPMELTAARAPRLPIVALVMLALMIVALVASSVFVGSQPRELPAPLLRDGGRWQPNNVLVATITLPKGDTTKYYWRMGVFDEFALNSWQSREVDRVDVPAGESLVGGTPDAAQLEGTTELTFHVRPGPESPAILLSPQMPVAVDKAAQVILAGEDEHVGAIERKEGGPYTVTSRVRLFGDEGWELNAAGLRAAGDDYPDDIMAIYGPAAIPDGAMPDGGFADQLLDQLVEAAPDPDNAFEFATYLKSRFLPSKVQGGLFDYTTDVNSLMEGPCKDISTVECFAQFGRGFCQHYASTFAIFMRAQGFPARVVDGYLPAQERSPDGVEVLMGEGRHEWVEVYFPRYGWVMFDPTGGSVSRQPAFQPGVDGAPPPGASAAAP